ncbi:hypothetical protein ABW21_db0203287 [Orbilia brochopaga]|nr:hypothetical protein ABW21_db0203287 [Drechslerella brochopaga]
MFLELLFHELPDEGKRNLGAEILLTTLHHEGTAIRLENGDDLISATNSLTINEVIANNLQQLATELKDCLIAPCLSDELKGEVIDTPKNTMMLTNSIHEAFGALRIWFTEKEVYDDDDERVVYKVEAKNRLEMDSASWPKDDLVTFQRHRGVDPPSRRLLRIHRALAIASTMSGAGDDVEYLLREETGMGVLAQDGSTADTLSSLINIAMSCK